MFLKTRAFTCLTKKLTYTFVIDFSTLKLTWGVKMNVPNISISSYIFAIWDSGFSLLARALVWEAPSPSPSPT